MGLDKYYSKRNFKVTSEPKGRLHKSKEKLIFVVQEHHASILHFDFRLESEGVLKSWSIPKGPSMNPKDKRLAVEVEDHPIEYAKFEGQIPKGEYGGGDVKIWDEGFWIPKEKFSDAYKKGKIEFELKGKRLRGSWTLIRLQHEKNWLLIKKKDGKEVYSSFGDNPEKQNLDKKTVKEKSKAQLLPEFIEPQLATLVDETPESGKWVYEIKFDGYRAICRREGKDIQLLTRSGQDWTQKYGPLEDEIRKIKADNFILDGEIAWIDEYGNSSFQGLQTALQGKNYSKLAYFVFDVLFLNGEDLRSLPLLERKSRLSEIISQDKNSKIILSEHWIKNEDNMMSQVCERNLEGVIAKRADVPYQSGRNEDWLKIKCSSRQEFVIGGYTSSPAQERPRPLGALLTGVFENGKLRYTGKVGTGFTDQTLSALEKKLKAIGQNQSPFELNSPKMKGVNWVKPLLIGEVEFKTWTKEGLIRQGSFQGLRLDKESVEVKVDLPKTASVNKSEKESTVLGVHITHPEKRLFPEIKATKLDVAQYYESVLPLVKPFLKNRPFAVMRCQEEGADTCFFQKHGTPGSVSKEVEYKDMSGTVMTINRDRDLIELVQNGTIEIHTWGAKFPKITKPDMLVFDLDPETKDMWPLVRETAFEIRELLKESKLKSFVKVTGGKGLHVQVPIKADLEWDEIREYSKRLMQTFEERDPDQYTTNSRKDKRKGRIFLDYLRNGYAATSVLPYSIRSRDYAPVALPISWNDLKKIESPSQFQMMEVEKLLRKRKDPWSEFWNLSQSLPKKLKF